MTCIRPDRAWRGVKHGRVLQVSDCDSWWMLTLPHACADREVPNSHGYDRMWQLEVNMGTRKEER